MRKSILLLLVLIVSVTVAGDDKKAAEKKSKVLLAFETTKFKSELIEEMKKQLLKSGFDVVVKNHSEKGLDAQAEDFDAVFITNSGVRSKVRPWIVKWLETNKEQKDRILLHTTQTKDWKVIADVDTVTSASSRGNVKKLILEYVGLIKKILKK